MTYELRSHRRQGNGLVVPESTFGLGSVGEARSLAKQSLASRAELVYSEIVDEGSGDVVETIRR